MSDDRFKNPERTFEEICSDKIEECGNKFRASPRKKFVLELAKEFAKRMKAPEVEILLNDLHKRKEVFPPMTYFEQEMKVLERKRWVIANPQKTAIKQRRPNPEPYVKKVEEYSISTESMFRMIQDAKMEGGAWNWVRRIHNHLTDEDLWDAYALWLEGKPYPKIFNQKPDKAPEEEAAEMFGE